MTTQPLFPGFDGLLSLSRREGVDIRPTLLRVLTDLYVQASSHTGDEERQFVELASRLIDQVDDATRAAVRGRLAIYPATPPALMQKLGLAPLRAETAQPAPASEGAPPLSSHAAEPGEADLRPLANTAMQPKHAAEICEMFFRAPASERALILHDLARSPLKAAPPIPSVRAKRAIETLEMAAFASDAGSFAIELGDSLILPSRLATQIVDDAGGEALAVAARCLDMPSPVFQRILLFFKPEIGTSVHTVYRLARLYDRLSDRSALIMLAAWRRATLALTRARYQPALFDDERQRGRAGASSPRPTVQPGSAPERAGTRGQR